MTAQEFLNMIEALEPAEELEAPRRLEDDPDRPRYVRGYGWTETDPTGWEDFE